MRAVVLFALAVSGCLGPQPESLSAPPAEDLLIAPSMLRLEACDGVGLRILGPALAEEPQAPPGFASRGNPGDRVHLQLDAFECGRAILADQVLTDVRFAYAFMAVHPEDADRLRPGAHAEWLLGAASDQESLSEAFTMAGLTTKTQPILREHVAMDLQRWRIGEASTCELNVDHSDALAPAREVELRDVWTITDAALARADVTHEATSASLFVAGTATLDCLPALADANGSSRSALAGVVYDSLSWTLPQKPTTYR